MERYVKGERIRFYYESKRLTTGLTDVKIDIIKTDGNKEISQGTLTELNSTNAPGVYYYEWVPTHGGTYLIYMDSLTDEYKRTIIEKLEVIARGSKYAQVMGVHGGMSTNRVSIRDTWNEEEKKRLIEALEKLILDQEEIKNKIEGFEEEIIKNSKKLGEFEEKDEFAVNSIKNIELASSQLLNSRLNEMSETINKLIAKQIITNNSLNITVTTLNDKINVLKEELDKEIKEYTLENKERVSNYSKELSEKNNAINDKISRINDSIEFFKDEMLEKTEPSNRSIMKIEENKINLLKSEINSINNKLKDNNINYNIEYPQEYFIEPSIDCLRLSLCKKGDEIKVILENGEEVTNELEFINNEIKELSNEDFMLDGGIIAIDGNSSEIINLLKDKKLNKGNILIYLWDCHHFKESLVDKELSFRKEILNLLNFNEYIRKLEYGKVLEYNISNIRKLNSGNHVPIIIRSINGKYFDKDKISI